MVQSWNPWSYLLREFEAVDHQWRDPSADSRWPRMAALLCLVAACLFLIQYLRFSSSFYALVEMVFGDDTRAALRAHPWSVLISHLWWGGVHLLGYVLLPLLFLRYVWREDLRHYGLGWNQTTRWLWACAAMAGVIIVFAFIASHSSSFQRTYPFYALAGRSWLDLALWEVIYLSQFIFLEFFFRGFLLHALAPRFGTAAIFVMVIPYLMIHFPKPWPEALGALPFGILLGVIALRSRSIWGGAFVHMSIALSMDVMSLAQTGRWPMHWIPQ